MTEEKEKRELIIPGETIVKGKNYLPGEGARREGENIVSSRFGLVEKDGRLIKIIPLSGSYAPRRGNTIIGKVADVTFRGWVMDINSAYSAFLPVSECPKYINKNDLAEHYNFGEMIVCKVIGISNRGIDLTVKGRGLGKLDGGVIIYINPSKVPRIIGKGGSMVNLIKEKTNCDITVGQNGIVWIRGDKFEDELMAKKAIMLVSEKSFIDGLTEKVNEFLGVKETKKEIKEEKKK